MRLNSRDAADEYGRVTFYSNYRFYRSAICLIGIVLVAVIHGFFII